MKMQSHLTLKATCLAKDFCSSDDVAVAIGKCLHACLPALLRKVTYHGLTSYHTSESSASHF
jgi:hypothetical protein